MQLTRHLRDGRPEWGVVVDSDTVIPLTLDDAALPTTDGILSIPRSELAELASEAHRSTRERVNLAELQLLAPIPRPGKIVAIGLNYADHIAESGLKAPEVPPVFAKFSSSVTGPNADVHRPRVSRQLDYEGELAVVIGTTCRHVSRDQARDVIGALVVLNDYSVRDWQVHSPQWSLAKSFDTHTPLGPWLTIDPDLDPHALKVETRVNGELRQSSSSSNLVFDAYDLISYLSQACTLHPGDIIATGTPGGVGAAMTPPKFLEPGDVVTVEIEGLGHITNRIVEEPNTTARIG